MDAPDVNRRVQVDAVDPRRSKLQVVNAVKRCTDWAKKNIQAFPEGQWTSKMRNPKKYEVTKQGVLNQIGKTVQDETYLCQLEKHTDSLWMWASPDRSIELILEEDCTVKVTSHQGDRRFQHRAEPSNKKTVISPRVASIAWNQALKEILRLATEYNDPEGIDEVLCAVLEGILQLFQWVSEFCDLFETCFAKNRNVLVQPLAEHIAHFLGEVSPECSDTQYFTRFFLGTALLAGLCVHWPRPKLWWDPVRKKALQDCVGSYGLLLEGKPEAIYGVILLQRTAVLNLFWKHLDELLNLPEVEDLPHFKLLKVVVATSKKLHRELPMQCKGRMNLEYLLCKCINQRSPNDDLFQKHFAECLGDAALCSSRSSEAPCRLAECVVCLCKQLSISDCAQILCIAHDATSPTMSCGEVIWELFRKSVPLQKCIASRGGRAAEETFQAIFRSLLQMPKISAQDLQDVLTSVLRLQTAWCWKTREQLGFLEELLQRFKAFSAGLVDDGKGGFALNFYTQVSIQEALKKTWTLQARRTDLPTLIEVLTMASWMEADVLCDLTLWCLKRSKEQQRLGSSWHLICLDVWQQLMSSTARSSQFELLLQAALESILPHYAQAYRFLRMLQETINSREQEIQQQAAKAVAAMTPRCLPLAEILQNGTGGNTLDWLSMLFLEKWIPSVSEVPPNSRQETDFVKWLEEVPISICAPQLISKRLGTMLPSVEGEQWSVEWPMLEKWPWPNLEILVKTFGARLDEAELPACLMFFGRFHRAAEEGYLPRKAYARLSDVVSQKSTCTCLNALITNIETTLKISNPSASCTELFAMQTLRSDELKIELQRQMQLLEWLVAKWGFQEIARPRAELKKKLSKVDDLPLVEVQREVQSACEIFQCFDQYDKGQEMFAFLRHLMRSGSALVKPLLEHFASVYARQQGQWSQDVMTSLDFQGFCQVVGLCHRDLEVLASGDQVSAMVWQLLVDEFLQKTTDMNREITLLLGYFLPTDTKKFEVRQQLLGDAFRIHRIAATVPDLAKALQLMKFDWLLDSDLLREVQRATESLGEVRSKHVVNVAADAAKLQHLRRCGFPDLKLSLFVTLLQRVCVYDFFIERGYWGSECMTRFQETLNIVQQSLEQDEIAVRQALLDELRHCAEVLRPFLEAKRAEQKAPSREIASETLVHILQSLAERRVRLEAFDVVAENLKLIGALFDSVQGTGSQLLLFSLRKILGGDLIIAPTSDFYCCYQGSARGEEVIVPSSSLSEYSVRSLMSLEGRDPDTDEAMCLKNYIRHMEAIVASDGLVNTSMQLHHAGHPNFRGSVRISMTKDLLREAKEQKDCLERWKSHVAKMLHAAPLLGLVPHGQLHSWLAEIQQHGLSKQLVRSLAESLSIWNGKCTEDYIRERCQNQVYLHNCCQGLKVIQHPAKITGRFVIREEVSEEGVLLLVVHLFLQWLGGPKRLPRPSEVLFCSKAVSTAEVEAFLWRSKQFPELLWVLVEPNHLGFEGKTLVANWLADTSDRSATSEQSAVVVILTAPWHLPSSVQQLKLKPDKSVVKKWKKESTTELMIYSSQAPPRGAGISSGKSTLIRKTAKERSQELVPCILHEGFQLTEFVSKVRKFMDSTKHPGRLALHIDVSAYSDPVVANFLLRHLFLCGVLYDPATGDIVYIPPGTHVYVEVGSLAGKRDVHSLRAYATEESLQAKFPRKGAHELDLILLYPILDLLGNQNSLEVQKAAFETEEPLTFALRLIQSAWPWQGRLQLTRSRWSDSIDLAAELPALQEIQSVLKQLATESGVVGGELVRSKEHFMVRRMWILSDWMMHCPLFTLQDREHASQLGYLLVKCMVVNLCQLHMGEEPCIHFVPTYTKTQQDHFCLFVPSLVDSGNGFSCWRGANCGCNALRRQLMEHFPGQLWFSEAPSIPTLELALEDERQGLEALSCAFGIKPRRLQEILRLEGYILTRDFACKILELLARRKSRAPAVVVGESGVGKTRALEMMTRLLLESDEVRPPIPQCLFDYMRAKLVKKKEDYGTDEMVSRVEKAMNSLLEDGFTLQGFKELLGKTLLYDILGEEEALFTRKELMQYLVRSVRESPRFEIGLLHMLLQNISPEEEVDAMQRAVPRSRSQWEALGAAAREDVRAQDTLALLCRLVGDEVNLSGLQTEEVDLTEEDTMDVSAASLQLTLKLVSLLPPQPIFFRVQVHAAMTATDIHRQLDPAFAACLREPDLTVVVFLDEVNTASCLGLIKAMLFDGLYGRYQNLFLVAAANPYREETVGVDQVLRGGDQVMRNFFQVHPLPPSFNGDIWNWRSPTPVDEQCYAILQLKKLEDLSDADVAGFAKAIAAAQSFMREQLCSESAVSQRDIIRVIRLLVFFRRRGAGAEATEPVGSERTRAAKAMLLAFGVCYYLGLNSKQRELFNEKVMRRSFASIAMEERSALDLPVILQEEMDTYMKHVVLPPSIAMTRALKENVFAVIVGIECKIPVMIVGMPGTGKTLAVNIATSVLRGGNAMPFFRDFCDVANSVFRYQCSKESTSRQIHEVFENALRAKQRMDLEKESQLRCPVVFIDEAGLPEERTESLKAIHYWIDRGDIFCCLLANKPLDAAKRNRCLQIFRDEADGHDLQLLASECLGVQLQDPSSRALVQGFCSAFEEISRGNAVSEGLKIFHLRDFHHCLRYLRRKGLLHSGGVAGKDVLRALQRNFGGLPADQFRELVEIFFKHLGEATSGLICLPAISDFQPTLDVLREALEDLPPEQLQDPEFEPCRYKLLIDATEDGGALRMLQALQLVPEGVSVLGASPLEGEQSQLHRNKTVSSLRRAAEQPKICVVSDFDEMLDGFYDMLNLRFQRINLKDRIGFAATIAAGSYSILAPVHPRFQLLVCIKASDVKQMPLPFLNRFEKYFLGPLDLACHRTFELCNGQLHHHFLEEYLLRPCRRRLDDLVQLLGASLVGCTEATIDSACCEAIESAKEVLATLATTWQAEVQETSTDVDMAPRDVGNDVDNHLHHAVATIASAAARKLLQLAPSETMLCHMTSLPNELLKGYAQRPHTGLASLLEHLRGDSKRRCLIFTRDTLQTSSGGGLLCTRELSRDDVTIHPMPRSREEALEVFQKSSSETREASKPLMILCRMEHGTTRAVNHLRRIADELDVECLITILLPPWRMHVSACYEAIFLGHWNMFHLDTFDDFECPALVSSILHPQLESVAAPQISKKSDEHDLLQDCWAAVARLPLIETGNDESMTRAVDVAAFYDPYASLAERVDALWSALKRPEFHPLLMQLMWLRSSVLQGVSLQREAVRVAREIIGIEGEKKRPMTSLQSSVRQCCAEQVLSALVEALHTLCDQGGLISLVEQGDPAIELMACYMKLRVSAATKKEMTRPLALLKSTMLSNSLPCFGHIFDLLQECVHSNATENFDLSQLVESTAKAWSKHSLFSVSKALLDDSIWHSYCQYVAQRFGFPDVVARVLHSLVQHCDEKRLPAMHAFAWCHRSDLAALGFLYKDNLPKEIQNQLQHPQGALLGDGLATCMINLAENELKMISKQRLGDHDLLKSLNTWHHSFESLRAALSGRLPLPASSRRQLHMLAFFSDLIPFLMEGGLDLLDKLMYQVFCGELEDRLALQKAVLNGIADSAKKHLQCDHDLTPLRSTLHRILEDMLWPLHVGSSSNLESHFEIIADLLFQVVDEQGFFQSTWHLITPAMASSVLTSLMEVVARSSSRPQLMKIFHNMFNKHASQTSSLNLRIFQLQGALQQFLCLALRSPHLRDLLELPADVLSEWLECIEAQNSRGDPFADAWKCAQMQQLLEAVVQGLGKLSPADARRLMPALEAMASRDEGMLLAFFDELMQQMGSATSAGKAIQDLQSKAGSSCRSLEAWSNALMQPEMAARGPGEDPWNDLPRASLPGFEGDQARRRRQDGERQRQDQLLLATQDSRCCPRCKRIIQKNGGCEQMECGRHAHQNSVHQEGCGHVFNWSQAPLYRPAMEESHPPPGFSAISEWLEMESDFLSSQAIAKAEQSLQGLSQWDRRYAVANACACRFIKQEKSQRALAEALLSDSHAACSLRQALCLEDERLAKTVALLCDAQRVMPQSQSLAAAALLGKDSWEESFATDSGALKLRHALVNLLVTVVGCPDNNHLWMLLFDPSAMVQSYPVGFVYGQMPGPEGYHFDCGCVLDQHGRTQRVRAPLENRHLHFVNFCSWAMLSFNLLLFGTDVDQILSARYVAELDPRSSTTKTEMARSYVMNFALRSFECVCLHQGLSADDRGLCFSKIFASFRQHAINGGPHVACCFHTESGRKHYEQIWREIIDDVLVDLPRLQKEALEVFETQGHLLQLQEFRQKKSYMQRFFHSFEACTLALPVEPELCFISMLLRRQEELVHLPLLGQIVQIENWIYDRLNGCLPVTCLDLPLIELLQRRQQRDEERGHYTNARRCQSVQVAFKKFLHSWQRFYDANRGEIPVECQAGRQLVGLEAQQTRLAKIEDGSLLPLRFFLSLDTKCQPLMVAEYLCRCWNDVVDAAGRALSLSTGRCATSWAEHIERSVPVWLADLFIQEQLAHTLNNMTLRRSVLRNLRDGSSVAPRIDWKAAQQEILSSHWVHRIQKLDFPQLHQFLPKRSEGDEMDVQGAILSEETQEKIRETFARMSSEDLAKCREALTRIASLMDTLTTKPQMLLDVKEVQSQVAESDLKELLEGLSVAALPSLRRLAEEESGEFRHLSPVLKATLPDGVNVRETLCSDWGDLKQHCAASLAEKDKLLRETITNLENEDFCHHLMDYDSKPLVDTYQAVWLDCTSLLQRLPSSVLGCHAVAVLQSLREILRDVRAQKSSLDQQSVWDPMAGLQPLPRWLLEQETQRSRAGPMEASAMETRDGGDGDWWEVIADAVDAPLPEEVESGEPMESEPLSAMQNSEVMLTFMIRACSDPEGAQTADANLFQILSRCQNRISRESSGLLQEVAALEEFLDIYEKQVSKRERSTAWQEALGSRIQLTPLDSVFSLPSCANLDLQKVSDLLWTSMASQTSCFCPGVWRRFVQHLGKCGHDKLETSINKALETDHMMLPPILTVPSKVEEEASHREVLLNYEGQYFKVLPLQTPVMSTEQGSASGLWSWFKGRFWGSKVKKDTSRVDTVEEAPKKRRRGLPATAQRRVKREEAPSWKEERLEDRKRLRGESSMTKAVESSTEMLVVDRFEVFAEDFIEPSRVTPLPEFGPKMKCSESFQRAMRLFLPDEPQKADALRLECQRIVRSKGTERPFGLEQEELFALVAFSFDLRHKFPDESRQKDFSVNLKKCVRERNRQSLQELGAFMHHLMNGLAKMKTPTEGLLYSMISSEMATVKVDQTVELTTFTTWTPKLESLDRKSKKLLSLRTKSGACDLSEILQLCNVPNLPEMVLLPSTVLRVVTHSQAELQLEALTNEDDF